MAARALSDFLAFLAARKLHGALGAPNLRFTLPDGRAVGAPGEAALATVHFQDARAPLALALDPPLAFGDLYAAGRIRVEGALERLVSLSNQLPAELGLLRRRPRTPKRWRQALGRAARNARHHYDAGNDFYALWLDERMVYTCAYFERPDRTLEEAQLAKLDLVCRKLRLRPGQRVLELGCGWGALALHMAGAYGVTVRAFNVSEQQVEWAREAAEKQGLASRVEFVLDDWRNATGRYDAFASVGMLEHVGPGHYDQLGGVIDRTLAPDGLGFLHTIGRSHPQPLNRWIQKRVFPNAHPPALSEMMRILEPRDLAVLDVENLRHHYALTAQHWLERYQRNRRLIDERVSEETARTYELYLAGTVAAFRDATLSLYQVVFTRARNDAIPWTRADLYRS
jgi:cyclopropane-fatty-acyl-phospholipid synthase